MSERIFLTVTVFVAWLFIGMPTIAAETNSPLPKSAAVMDFELIDEMRDYSGKTLYTKSVDLRSNSDKSWLRGIRYMADSVAEKKQYLRCFEEPILTAEARRRKGNAEETKDRLAVPFVPALRESG